MNERVIFSDFVSSFANTQKGDKQSVEKLLTTLFELIEKHLLIDKVVKVRHIGVFKLDWFEPRKITNVNTGEISEIGGYYRLVFTPDKEMAAAVNENYSHLQAVSLTNGLETVSEKEEEVLEAAAEENKEEERPEPEKSFIPLNEIKEELQDAQSIIQEISAMSQGNSVQSSTSDSSEMDLLAKLYESEAKNTFSERYARLASILKEEKKEVEEIVLEPIVEAPISEPIVEEITTDAIIEEPIIEASTVEVAPINPLEAILNEADKFRSSLFKEVNVIPEVTPTIEETIVEKAIEQPVLIEEIKPEEPSVAPEEPQEELVIEEVTLLEPTTSSVEEIEPEPTPTQEAPTTSSEPIVEQPEKINLAAQIIREAATEELPETAVNIREKRPISKWSIVGIVVTILLIIATFGYIYSGYFNKGKANKDIFEQTFESIMKLFEPKSVEIERNDMTLSISDSLQAKTSKDEAQQTQSKTQPQPTDNRSKSVEQPTSTVGGESKTIKVDFAETLSSIARREYGSRFFWCYIYEANKEKIKDINNLQSGTQLVIPDKRTIGIDSNNESSLSLAKEKCRAIEVEFRNRQN